MLVSTPDPVSHAPAHAVLPADLCSATGQASGATGDVVDSAALLQGKKSITIVHNGAAYRLQATKLGKLILTK